MHAERRTARRSPWLPGADLRALAATLLCGLLLWTLAYQLPLHFRLDIGGDQATGRREDDAPFLRNVNGSEPASRDNRQDWRDLGLSYRWTRSDSALAAPGVGGGRWLVTLRAGSGRADGAPAISEWQAGATPLPPLEIGAAERIYRVLARADAAGDLTLSFATRPYAVDADPRDLGFVLREARIAPTGGGPRLPALAQLGWLAATLALVYSLARWLSVGRRPALLLTLGCALASALALANYRMALTPFTATAAALAASGWGLALAVRGAALIATRLGLAPAIWRNRSYGPVVALVLLAFALRMGGMLHPHAIFSDQVFNANNLFRVSLGQVFLTAGLPTRAGGGEAPYPPGMYLLLIPAQLLFPVETGGRVLLVQAGAALLDSLVVALIWGLLVQAGVGRRAALLGAAGYLLPPPLLESFSIGEYANIGGQALALPAIALLAWNWPRRPAEPSQRGYTRLQIWVPLLCIGLLGHFGVAISLATLLAGAWLVGAFDALRPETRGTRFDLGKLTLGGGLAALAAALLYYSAPIYLEVFGARLGGAGEGSGATGGLALQQAGQFLLSIIGMARPDGRAPLPGLLVVSSLMGLALLHGASRPGSQHRGLAATLVAWWLGVLISQALLLIASQGVRWTHFLYPALCLGAGPTLAAWGRRGRAGRIVGGAVVAAALIYGLTVWIIQIRDYLH